MKASDILNKERHAAQTLFETEQTEVERENNEFCVRLCDELLRAINPDATLNDAQAEFVGVTVGSVGYKFMPGHDVKYKETPVICPLLVLQLATYINSCK